MSGFFSISFLRKVDVKCPFFSFRFWGMWMSSVCFSAIVSRESGCKVSVFALSFLGNVDVKCPFFFSFRFSGMWMSSVGFFPNRFSGKWM